MQRKQYYHVLSLLLCFVTLLGLWGSPVHADMGPKPSIRIDIIGLEDTCIATLLCIEEDIWGYQVYDRNDANTINRSDRYDGYWRQLMDYPDPDQYHYLQNRWKFQLVDGQIIPTHQGKESTSAFQLKNKDGYGFEWDYRVPSSFKILLYFPATDSYAVSEILHSTHFDSHFSVDVRNIDLQPGTTFHLKATDEYNYFPDVVGMLARIVGTVLVEVLVALLFRYRAKKQLKLIIITNVATNILLHTLLTFVNVSGGAFTAVILLFFGELAVFTVEWLLYSNLLPQYEPQIESPRRRTPKAFFYALAANAASFLVGEYLMTLPDLIRHPPQFNYFYLIRFLFPR